MEDSRDKFANKTVLVIEDEMMMRRLATQLLKDIGFSHVLSAENGVEGLKMLKMHESVSVVICDLEMPLMGGLEFLTKLRSGKNVRNSGIPVVVVTGHREEASLYKAIDIGIHGYIVKPISRAALEKHLAHALTSELIDPLKLAKKQQGLGDAPPVLDFNKE